MNHFKKSEAGYSLISTASMLVIIGLGTVGAISLYKQNEIQKRAQQNKDIQSAIKEAMNSFRAKNGRYPCPAPMNSNIDTNAFGKEIGGNCSTATPVAGGTWNVAGRGGRQVQIGAIPTRTLNIDDKFSVDAYGSKIIYAVTEQYASPTAPFDQDLGAISIRDPNGNNITSVPGNAIYTMVLPGTDQRGAYSLSGNLKQPCNTGAQAGENCDNNNAIFMSNSFLRDIEANNKFTAMLGFESSNQEFYWDVGAWSSASCPTACGQAASSVNINRNVTCRVVGTNAGAANALCPQNPVLQTVSAVSCPATAACPPPPPPTTTYGGGGGGGSDGSGYQGSRPGDVYATRAEAVRAGGTGAAVNQNPNTYNTSSGYGNMGSSSSGGGSSSSSRVICTHFFRKGQIERNVWVADIHFTASRLSKTTVRGYHLWAIPYVKLMRTSPLAEKLMWPIAYHRAQELAYQMGIKDKPDYLGKLVRLVFEPACFLLGLFVQEQNYAVLYSAEDLKSIEG